MLSFLPSNAAHPGARFAPSAAPERCPFLQEVGALGAAPRPRLNAPAAKWNSTADARATQVLQAFERTGGLASGDQLTPMLRRRTSQPLSMLGRWIAERRVIAFAWRGEYLLPLFQFDRADMGVRACVAAVLDELDGTFDDWELATWFALPNAWLHGAAPIDAIELDAEAVRQAARADRYVARG